MSRQAQPQIHAGSIDPFLHTSEKSQHTVCQQLESLMRKKMLEKHMYRLHRLNTRQLRQQFQPI
jgi:hypothetical protein